MCVVSREDGRLFLVAERLVIEVSLYFELELELELQLELIWCPDFYYDGMG